MSVLIYLGLFFAYGLAVRPVFSLALSPGALFTAQLVLGIGWLVIPLAAFSAIDRAWWKRHVRGVARDWCSSTGIDFKRAELHKNHFTAVGVADGQECPAQVPDVAALPRLEHRPRRMAGSRKAHPRRRCTARPLAEENA